MKNPFKRSNNENAPAAVTGNVTSENVNRGTISKDAECQLDPKKHFKLLGMLKRSTKSSSISSRLLRSIVQ